MIAVLVTTSLLALVFAIIYQISKRKYDYWEKQNVPYVKPTPILGNYGEYILLQKYVGEVAQKLCQKFPDAPYVGAFYGSEPALIVQDPELIQLITTKDFYYFSSREIAKHTHKEVITQNLFFTYGDRWKTIRQNLTPLFTSAKMKNMFYLIEKCAHLFEKMLEDETSNSQTVEARSLMARYTMDCICSCAFGVETNTMGKNKNNAFTVMGDMIFEISNYRGFKWIARAVWPAIFYGLGFKTFPTSIDKFFNNLLMGVFDGRQYKPSSRNDFVDLVLDLKKKNFISGDSIINMKPTNTEEKKKVNIKVDDDLLVSQCIMFFAAGFETSASTLSFTLYEIAKSEEAQKRAHEEVDEYLRKNEGKLKYDCLTELPYLEACIDEVLRLYPVLGIVTREVVEDYTLPTGVRLEKGTRVHLPVYHLQRRPDFFPNPDQFVPERFLGEAKKDIKPYTYMPFGEGNRICIGMRFAKMQMLPGLITLLKKYRVELADGMPWKVKLEPKAIVTQSIGGIKLKLKPRADWEQRVYARQG